MVLQHSTPTHCRENAYQVSSHFSTKGDKAIIRTRTALIKSVKGITFKQFVVESYGSYELHFDSLRERRIGSFESICLLYEYFFHTFEENYR